ncbi:MAG: alanine--tRNA ligase, partial [SAR324 cluster bacterium]|nr:alanine--tRNA ligase [SAR324 cluster bacterium]
QSAIEAVVSPENRSAITRNHTATHLLHAALKEVVGQHVNQAGSVVHPEYLRFDFTHFDKLSDDEITRIEQIVNRNIRANISLQSYETQYTKAIQNGVTALFSEKYADRVRVIQIGAVSSELCGGCHVHATGDIGSFRIQVESAIASGVRRIIALTGHTAEKLTREESRAIQDAKRLLNVSHDSLAPAIEKLLEEKRHLEKALRESQRETAGNDANRMASQAITMDGIRVLVHQLKVDSLEALKDLGDSLRETLKPGIILLAGEVNQKPTLLCVISQDLLNKKFHAGDIVNQVAALADGKGGGKPHMAQAGIKAPEKLPQALLQAPELIRAYIQSR